MIRIITTRRLKELEDIENKHLVQQASGTDLVSWLSVVVPEYPAIWAYIKGGYNASHRLRDEIERIRTLKSKPKINMRLGRLEDNLNKGLGINTLDWSQYFDENGNILNDKDVRTPDSKQQTTDE